MPVKEFKNLSVRIRNGTLPRVPFLKLKEIVLGPDYELSVAFVGAKESRELNLEHRKKDYPANVLSFPLSKTSGEIVICPPAAFKDAKKFGKSRVAMIPFLFIHGLFHLKGMRHSSKMEAKEAELRSQFGL